VRSRCLRQGFGAFTLFGMLVSEEDVMSSPQSFEQAIEASHRALDEITRGNP